MLAVRGHAGDPVVVELDEPPGTGELLSMRSIGICGSDLMYLRLGTERVLGHELAGLRADGTAVALEGLFGCGSCPECLAGHNNRCGEASNKALGIMQDGGMAERFRQPDHKLVPLPDGLAVADGALVEPASVAWHGVRRGGVGPGDRVAVVGGGSIGQLAAAAAVAQGAGEVALEARHPHQHGIRERLGFTEPGGLYDVVVESAGSATAIQRCVELARPGATIVILGVVPGPLDVPFSSLLRKELTVAPSMGYCGHPGGREMAAAAQLLADRPEIPAALITHRFPLADAAEAFRVAADRSSGAVKVIVEVG